MNYVYLLFSEKDKGLYLGFTENLKKRFFAHESGLVRSTKFRRPLKLIHCECFVDKKDAKARERYLKSGYGRQQLKSQLKNIFRKLESS